MSSISEAHMFAAGAHGGLVRKENIPAKTTSTTRLLSGDCCIAWRNRGDANRGASAWVVEDTHVTIEMVRDHFGERVLKWFRLWPTLQGQKTAIEYTFHHQCPGAGAKSRHADAHDKLADLLDNTSSIVSRDPEFSLSTSQRKNWCWTYSFTAKRWCQRWCCRVHGEDRYRTPVALSAMAKVTEGIALLKPVHINVMKNTNRWSGARGRLHEGRKIDVLSFVLTDLERLDPVRVWLKTTNLVREESPSSATEKRDCGLVCYGRWWCADVH